MQNVSVAVVAVVVVVVVVAITISVVGDVFVVECVVGTSVAVAERVFAEPAFQIFVCWIQ